MPLAMREVAGRDRGQRACDLAHSIGEALLDQLAQGGLVPDWIDVSPDGVEASKTLSENTGYDWPAGATVFESGRVSTASSCKCGTHGPRFMQERCSPAWAYRPYWTRSLAVFSKVRAMPDYQAIAGLVHLRRRRGTRRAHPAIHARSTLLSCESAPIWQ